MIIGERAYKAISDRAAENEMEVKEYAKTIGIDHRNVSNWKVGYSEPRAYSLSLMAEAGLDTYWILTGQRVDTVEVVRSKDCKHSDWFGSVPYCLRHECNMYAEGFCSDGEREVADNAID